MSPPSEHDRRFVDFLEELVKNENRGALAALRRGLGKAPGEVADLYPYVVPWLPKDGRPRDEEALFLVAALFASHQTNWRQGGDGRRASSFGASFALLAEKQKSSSVEKRFIALLNCRREDLPNHLRYAVSLLKSHDIGVDWAGLLQDMRGWDRQDRRVQREWARAFFGTGGTRGNLASGNGSDTDSETGEDASA